MTFLLSKHLRSESGQSVVEMSLMLMAFVLMFFAVLEYSHYFYTRLTVRHALREAVQYAATGQANIADPQNPDSNLPRTEAIRAVFDRHLKGTSGSNLQEFTLTPADGGAPEETVSLRVRFNKPFFTGLIGNLIPAAGNCPAGHLCMEMNMVWLNEPFTVPGGGGA